jgi:hypothetical protein
MLHFYKSIRCFNKITENDDKINFECKICNDKFISPFKDKSNLYKHLKHHKAYLDWKSAYDKCKNKIIKPRIGADTLLLIKFFVSSNVSHSSLENKYLRILLNKVIGTKSFDETILPAVYQKLRVKLEEKLHNAGDICLMSDIWTAKHNSDFIGLVTAVMNDNSIREIFVADMMRMPGNTHNAENIKEAIETMVKQYFLNK